METIQDIVNEIRRLSDDGFPLDGESSHSLVEDMRLLADRIEQAVTNCNQLKLREALLKSRKAMDEMSMSIFRGWIEDSLADVAGEAQKAISSALSAPPRNCDLYATEAEAYRGWERYYNSIDPKDGYLDFEDWLFAKAEGDVK